MGIDCQGAGSVPGRSIAVEAVGLEMIRPSRGWSHVRAMSAPQQGGWHFLQAKDGNRVIEGTMQSPCRQAGCGCERAIHRVSATASSIMRRSAQAVITQPLQRLVRVLAKDTAMARLL